MQLKNGCFNWALFRKNMTRFWPIWVLSTLGWLVVMPLMVASAIINSGAEYLQMNADYMVAFLAGKCYIIAFVDAIVCAMAVFSYLFQHRSAVAIHMMPMRRECLFITNYLSGLALMVLPMVICLGITVVTEGFFHCLNWTLLLMWFTAQMLANLSFYSLAVFCAGLTGNLVMYPILYVGLQMVPEILRELISSVCDTLLRGFYSFPIMDEIARWLSPLWNMYANIRTVWRASGEHSRQYFLHGWKCLLAYLAVSLVLMLAALALYRVRRVETAGDVIAIPALRPAFRIFFTFFCGIVIAGMLSSLIFDSNNMIWSWKYVLIYLMLLAGGFIGYFAAQMMLNKTLNVFKRGWAGYSVCMLFLVAAVCAVKMDLMGFETWLPEADRVESVELVSAGVKLKQEETLQQVVALHTNIVDHLSEQQALVQSYYNLEATEYYSEEDGEYYIDGIPADEWYSSHEIVPVTIIYHMSNGISCSRSYSIYLDEAQLADESSVASQLQTLVNMPEYVQESSREIIELDLSEVEEVNLYTYKLVDSDYYEECYVGLIGADAKTVVEAIRRDLSEEDGLQNWLLESMSTGQVFTWSNLSIAVRNTSQVQVWGYYGDTDWYDLSITDDWSNTIQALTDLGILDEEHILGSGKSLQDRSWVEGMERFDARTHSYVSAGD